ncbi:isocitrate lyase/phosphoenolpyruvate mutase family protein [Asanoa sp. WMMD1127]|uniref:isocitrate lyase/PEP mutase family protein n=1 Tax=Asanoa sp. WMMD1127 TaxID=3016107 RepID=UPI0024173CD9|nr:isocitrate lyase/phosphoenolpyruvate mutase family protein [Asanoa sp. WMMD1127]MDG4825776.1 isocitrate lyase/phosphoenolpyruvate mutase family protein [Asanoa sp. WMMD1127]
MTFRELHDGALPLLLPNAWDVASAIAFVEAGFPAVGTTSFGVAAGAGAPDGRGATRDATRALAHALAALPAHVSVDVEDGYSESPEEVADYVAGLRVAGVNLEDSTGGRLVEPAAHAAKVAAVKARNPDVYVNARTDTYWLGQDATLSATLERAAAYVEAGADGVFVPGATKPAELRDLAANLPVPVNVLVIPELSLAHLADLGIRRVSTGSLPYRAALDAAVAVATAVRDGAPPPAATPYQVMQDRLLRYARG